MLVDVDDEDAELFVIALHAIDVKIQYSIRSNVFDALKMLQAPKKTPDIIFLDYHMPYLDGSEFLKLLRKMEGLEKTPVVLYSGHSGGVIRDAA